MDETLQIDPAYKIMHCFIWLLLIGTLYPIYRILDHVFGKHSGVSHSNKKNKMILKYSKFTKYFLLISIILSFSYIFTTSIQTIIMFINGYISPAMCPFLAVYRMFSYVAGRVILYLYFISRANDIFRDTYLAFSKRSILALTFYDTTFFATLIVPSIIIYYYQTEWYIASDINGNGSYCAYFGGDNIKYVFLWGSFNDLMYSIVTICMMVSRLFLLLKDNERKKSHTKRYDFASSPSLRGQNKQQTHKMQRMKSDTELDSDAEMPESPDGMSSSSRKFNFSTSSQHMTVQSSHDLKLNKVTSVESKKISTKIGNKEIEITKVKVEVSNRDAEIFHKKTAGHNKLILLMSKFFIILLCLVLSSQMVLILFLVFRDSVMILYSLDTFINMICLFLTFHFSDKYYNKYFCGKCCTPFCFPLIKTIALSVDQYQSIYIMSHNMDKWLWNNICCIYCKCFCCASCRYCCAGESLSKEIYDLAKQEIKLIVKQEAEKKLLSKSTDEEHTVISANQSTVK